MSKLGRRGFLFASLVTLAVAASGLIGQTESERRYGEMGATQQDLERARADGFDPDALVPKSGREGCFDCYGPLYVHVSNGKLGYVRVNLRRVPDDLGDVKFRWHRDAKRNGHTPPPVDCPARTFARYMDMLEPISGRCLQEAVQSLGGGRGPVRLAFYVSGQVVPLRSVRLPWGKLKRYAALPPAGR